MVRRLPLKQLNHVENTVPSCSCPAQCKHPLSVSPPPHTNRQPLPPTGSCPRPPRPGGCFTCTHTYPPTVSPSPSQSLGSLSSSRGSQFSEAGTGMSRLPSHPQYLTCCLHTVGAQLNTWDWMRSASLKSPFNTVLQAAFTNQLKLTQELKPLHHPAISKPKSTRRQHSLWLTWIHVF